MSAEQTKGFLSKWHNFHLLCAWLTVTTKASMLARKAVPQACGGGLEEKLGQAGPVQQPSPVKALWATVTEGHRLQQHTTKSPIFFNLLWSWCRMKDPQTVSDVDRLSLLSSFSQPACLPFLTQKLEGSCWTSQKRTLGFSLTDIRGSLQTRTEQGPLD